MCNRALPSLFWPLLDALDYWVMQARLWMIDALSPETAANRKRGVISIPRA